MEGVRERQGTNMYMYYITLIWKPETLVSGRWGEENY